MILDLVTLNDPRLHEKSVVIDKIDDDIKELVEDMYETMYSANGIGLSAVQVGVMKRLFITDVPVSKGKIIAINPVIKNRSDIMNLYDEGCLSVPGVYGEVERPETVTLEYTDIKGKLKTITASGLMATCIQHEFDHLEGVLFIDRLPPDVKTKTVAEYRTINKL